ncbi:MAG: cupin domain-containing protein [Actinomycetota bacterium]|nr:cupin domain-containing protein [Actinomycetota bacterium]
MSTIESTAGQAYALPGETGVSDFWLPFVPGVSRISTKVSGEQTEGRLLQVRSSDSRGAAPPLHIHHDADETWYVIDGRLTVFVGDERIEAGPGDFVFGPMGVPHAFLVTSERAESLITFSPAGTKGPSGYGVDGFFREAAIPAIPGQGAPEPTEADPEHLARLMLRYGIELVGPPPTLD